MHYDRVVTSISSVNATDLNERVNKIMFERLRIHGPWNWFRTVNIIPSRLSFAVVLHMFMVDNGRGQGCRMNSISGYVFT